MRALFRAGAVEDKDTGGASNTRGVEASNCCCCNCCCCCIRDRKTASTSDRDIWGWSGVGLLEEEEEENEEEDLRVSSWLSFAETVSFCF